MLWIDAASGRFLPLSTPPSGMQRDPEGWLSRGFAGKECCLPQSRGLNVFETFSHFSPVKRLLILLSKRVQRSEIPCSPITPQLMVMYPLPLQGCRWESFPTAFIILLPLFKLRSPLLSFPPHHILIKRVQFPSPVPSLRVPSPGCLSIKIVGRGRVEGDAMWSQVRE